MTEIATVSPAKIVARPAEAPASAAASRGVEPLVQELSEARDDEQRVVDADADPDHRHEDRRDRVDVGQAGEDEEQDERGSDGHDRERDRDRGRRRTCGRRSAARSAPSSRPISSCGPCSIGGNSASPLNSAVTPAGSTVVADRVLAPRRPVAVLRLDHVVELRLGVGDAPVLGEGVLVEGVADALDADLVAARLELGGLELRDRGLRRRPCTPACRGAAPRARRRRGSGPSPARRRTRDSIRSVALCVSDPGISNSSFRPPPTVATRTIRTTRMPPHAAATRPGCAAHARIQRASPPVASRSCAAV